MKQAFYNVIKNSLEAMKRRGILRIRTDMDARMYVNSRYRRGHFRGKSRTRVRALLHY